jgi:hypothetical protein
MPNKDKTGPQGKGPRTGLGLGPCAESSEQITLQRGLGRGRGYGVGRRINRKEDVK